MGQQPLPDQERRDLAIGDRYRVPRTVHPAGQSFAQAGAMEHFVATLTKAATFVDRAGS